MLYYHYDKNIFVKHPKYSKRLHFYFTSFSQFFQKQLASFQFFIHTQSNAQSGSNFRTIEYTTLYTKVLEHFQYRKKRFSQKTINIGKQSELFHDCRLITIHVYYGYPKISNVIGVII